MFKKPDLNGPKYLSNEGKHLFLPPIPFFLEKLKNDGTCFRLRSLILIRLRRWRMGPRVCRLRGRRLRSRYHGCPAYPHPLPQSSRHLLPRCPLRWRMLTTQPQRLQCCITKGMFSLTFCTNLLVAPKQYHMHNIKISLNKHSYISNPQIIPKATTMTPMVFPWS